MHCSTRVCEVVWKQLFVSKVDHSGDTDNKKQGGPKIWRVQKRRLSHALYTWKFGVW